MLNWLVRPVRLRRPRAAAAIALCLATSAWTPTSAHPGHAVEPVAPAHRATRPVRPAQRRWLAGDHHVHSWFSVSVKPAADPSQPPILVKAGDASNPITTNARMAARHGLTWMVATDHGGPNHSKLNRDEAYPELLRSRRETPGVLQFWGMELDTPAAEHSSLILPRSAQERDALFGIESGYNRREPWPADPARDTEGFMLRALRHMKALPEPPVVIANHPSRSATGVGRYGLVSPSELRDWNDTAPDVAVGMEGAPGHQASSLNPDGSLKPKGDRGGYSRAPTMGGFDQMTAKLGGFWDAMLGEGRRWWITSTSDSHRHYTDGGDDFWPGEYSKTYVKAVRTYDDVLDGLRNGRIFVTLGDLVSEVDVTAMAGGRKAEIGGNRRHGRDPRSRSLGQEFRRILAERRPHRPDPGRRHGPRERPRAGRQSHHARRPRLHPDLLGPRRRGVVDDPRAQERARPDLHPGSRDGRRRARAAA